MPGEGVAVVEWAERVEEWLPQPRLRVDLAHRAEGERLLILTTVPALSEEEPLGALLAALTHGGGVLEIHPGRTP